MDGQYHRYIWVSREDVATVETMFDEYIVSGEFRKIEVQPQQQLQLLEQIRHTHLRFTLGVLEPSRGTVCRNVKHYWILTLNMPFGDGYDFFQNEIAHISQQCRNDIFYFWKDLQARPTEGFQIVRAGEVIKRFIVYHWLKGVEIDGTPVEWWREKKWQSCHDYLASEQFRNRLCFFFPADVLRVLDNCERVHQDDTSLSHRHIIYLHEQFTGFEQYLHHLKTRNAMDTMMKWLYSNVVVFILVGILVFLFWLFVKTFGGF